MASSASRSIFLTLRFFAEAPWPEARAVTIWRLCHDPQYQLAGRSLPREAQTHFPTTGTHVERYAQSPAAAEINSSFHRPHRPATYARWSASVPATFRFFVKLPRTISHEARLVSAGPALDAYLPSPFALRTTLGCLLMPLPPSLAFSADLTALVFGELRARYVGPVAAEPHHTSWFGDEAHQLLMAWQIGRVVADPARVSEAAIRGGWLETVYYRLHGSPRMYYSGYDDAFLDGIAVKLVAAPAEAWCISDNTTLGAATGNALGVVERVRNAGRR